MLDLLSPQLGPPSVNPVSLHVSDHVFLLYPSAHDILVLQVPDLSLTRVLAFHDIVPAAKNLSSPISDLVVDPAMNLIVASIANHLAAWTLSQVSKNTWRTHSSLSLPLGCHISAIDCRSGLLAIAYTSTLSVYSLILENDLPTWSKKWSTPLPAYSEIRYSLSPPVWDPTPIHVRFSPSLNFIATITQQDNLVRIYLTTSGRQIQAISHPLPVTKIAWRQAERASRDDLILYTVTSDATLRVFMPVIDAPRHLVLHAALDIHSALPYSVPPSAVADIRSTVFWLDRDVVAESLGAVTRPAGEEEDARTRRARDIKEEGWDLFLRFFSDGSLVASALANIDRRPPTLLKQFTILQSSHPLRSLPTSLLFLSNPVHPGLPTLITSSPLTSFALSPADFFDARPDGLVRVAQLPDAGAAASADTSAAHISRFVRTPEGAGVAVVREVGGGGEAWGVRERGRRLARTAGWAKADDVVVLDRGRTLVTYSAQEGLLTLHTSTPHTLPVPPLTSLFALPPSSPGTHTCLYALTHDTPTSILHIHAYVDPAEAGLELQSTTRLPLEESAEEGAFIVQVDPMAWSWSGGAHGVHDVLLSVGADGELGFWVPDGDAGIGAKSTVANGAPPGVDENDAEAAARRRTGWKRTGRVRTGRTGIRMARCSSAKKTVLIRPGELTIWDSKASQFASGLEYTVPVADDVRDLDWSATPDGQSILAVGYAARIEILVQQRATYFDEDPGWARVREIRLEGIMPHPIGDSIWLANGTLLVGAGPHMLLYGHRPNAADDKRDGDEHLFEHVARKNGPLVDFHPQMVLQCLLWGKLDLVKDVVVGLARDVERLQREGIEDERAVWTPMPIERFLGGAKDGKRRAAGRNHIRRHSTLFDLPTITADDGPDDGFSRSLVEKLLAHLESHPLPHLTPNEHSHLLVLIQATLEVDEARRALDANGLRYLVALRSFYILNARPGVAGAGRERMRFRDFVWAFHSESQGLLVSSCVAACENKMTWADARALGVFMWMTSADAMKTQLEAIARNEYMADDARDPVACSLFYFALGKHKLVHGLWRQAAWHKEQQAMLKFLGNDFSAQRWRTAANKNAFALLSKRRFEYAAAFFLLAGCLKDAVNVCVRNLDDFQLAVALARVVEGDDGPVLASVLESRIVPEAFRTGNRYLGSWAFWMLRRRDLAVRILVTPLMDIASELSTPIKEIGQPHYDDPSLALLFSQLKAKTLQAAKGTSEISGRVEFEFVLQIAQVFVRMGCHVLALDLLRSWSFDRPSTVERADPASVRPRAPPSPTMSRFALEPAMRRHSSIMIDMDVSTQPPTRRASPTQEDAPAPAAPELAKNVDGDLVARKAGLGSLMKAAKQNVQVPEFDMNAFF